jgi:DNA-binding response OmpR family regulator
MQNILIIAPNEKGGAAAYLGPALKESGYDVAVTSLGGTSAIEYLCEAFDGRPPDIIVADLSTAQDCLPLRHARKLLRITWGEELPLPLCLALLETRHLALADWRTYIDDFLLPPHSPGELLARVAHLLFRKRDIRSGDVLGLADVTLDLAGGRAFDSEGHLLALTPREYDLLRFLGTHRGKFFARDRLLDMVWGVDFDGGERTVDIHVRRLRAKLPPQTAAMLETRRGVGYGLTG